MEDISVIFTVTRTSFQFIDDDGNFTLSETERAYCDKDGNILTNLQNEPLAHDPEYNLYKSDSETPVQMLAKAAKKLGCTKAKIFPKEIITLRSSPRDMGSHLDFYKCFFRFEHKATLQITAQYFEIVNVQPKLKG